MNDREYIEEMKRLGAVNANLRFKISEVEKKNTEITYFFEKQIEMLQEEKDKLEEKIDFWKREAIASKAAQGEEKIAQYRNGWIPCGERLPDKEECNVFDKNHPNYRKFICTVKIALFEPQVREIYYSEVFGWKYGPEDYNEHVTSWQPLPDPWKE